MRHRNAFTAALTCVLALAAGCGALPVSLRLVSAVTARTAIPAPASP